MSKFKSGRSPLVCVGSFIAIFFALSGPAGAVEPQPHLARSVETHVANPHLHGVKPAIVEAHSRKHLARHWVGRWSYADWAVVHRGLRNITGQVYSSEGSVAGVRVALRNAKGKAFSRASARHVTHTNSAGVFFMRNVRIGNYRVRATRGKAVGAVPLHVGSAMSMVTIRL